jgi:hypothetical protein
MIPRWKFECVSFTLLRELHEAVGTAAAVVGPNCLVLQEYCPLLLFYGNDLKVDVDNRVVGFLCERKP